MLSARYTYAFTAEESGGYSAEILEFPGCFAEGETLEDAMAALEKAAESWITAALGHDQPIPAPFSSAEKTCIRNQREMGGRQHVYGGKIALRLPSSLHQQAVECASHDGVSLNQFLVVAIAVRVGTKVGDTEQVRESIVYTYPDRTEPVYGCEFF